jgi:diguanylate cyclase (GGDEF)-like protein
MLAAILGNGLSVMGAAFAWVAARSLRGLPTPWWLYVAPGTLCGLATWWEHPEGGAWPGGVALLVGMGAMLGLSAGDLIALHRTNPLRVDRRQHGEAHTAIAVLAFSSVAACAFYAIRAAAFLTVGPESSYYVDWVGPRTTTFLVLILLVVVSYTVTALSHFEIERGWRTRAVTDDLTGLLHRSAFLEQAQHIMNGRAGNTTARAVIVADIDHFKDVNDLYGHAHGDRVLIAFSRATRAALGDQDLAARFGGEEFVIFLADADVDVAISVTDAINAAFESTAEADRKPPTVSYGVAGIRGRMSLEEAIHLADGALYRAKRAGRAQVAAHEHDES